MTFADNNRVEIALTTAPFATPTWTDITDQVLFISRDWQRSGGPGGPVNPGQMVVTVENNDGRWNNASTYASAPYAGNVIPDRRIRWRVSTDSFSTSRTLFEGFLDDVQDSATIFTGQTDLVASDSLRLLEQAELTNLVRPAEMPGERIDAILSAISWPAGLTGTTDNGTVMLAAETLTGSALAACQNIAQAELGLFYADTTSVIQFRDRYHTVDEAVYSTSQETFGGEEIEFEAIPYDQGAFVSTRAVTAVGESGNVRRYTSTALPANWPRTTTHITDAPLLYDGDAENLAEAYQKIHETDPPQEGRISGIRLWVSSLGGGGVPGLLDAVRAGDFELFVAVSVLWRPAGWTADHDFNATVESVTHRVDARDGTWYAELGLSPRFTKYESQVDNHFYTYGSTLTTDHRGSI